jgi:hypothetical protein
MVIGEADVPEDDSVNDAYVPGSMETESPGLVAAFTAAWIVQYGVAALSIVESEHPVTWATWNTVDAVA